MKFGKKDKASRKHSVSAAKDSARGFTLVEVLVLVTLVVFVAFLISPRFSSLKPATKVHIAKAQISMFSVSLGVFKDENGYFPDGKNGLNDLVVRPTGASNWHQYLQSIPLDPWGHPYAYRYFGANLSPAFEIVSAGQDGQFGTADDIRNLDAHAK